MDAEDYPSSEDSSDEEYIPSDGEKGSEEENSGEEEDFVPTNDDENQRKGGKRKRTKTKPAARKRTGGIRLEEEEPNGESEKQDDYNKELAHQVKEEESKRKEQEEKKKADSLWADFMKDVGGPKPKPKTSSGGLGSLSSITKSSVPAKSPAISSTLSKKDTPAAKKITVTQEFDFAGEIVKVSKEVDADSKEARAVETQEASNAEPAKPTAGPAVPGFKRTGGVGGLGSVLGKIGKKPKISTLEKSKLDWNNFKSAEGIEEELRIHNRGKEGFIERQQFLERTDVRQFEIEKNLRLKNKFL